MNTEITSLPTVDPTDGYSGDQKNKDGCELLDFERHANSIQSLSLHGSDERRSEASDISIEHIEFPCDIPDSAEFSDLSAYLSNITDRLKIDDALKLGVEHIESVSPKSEPYLSGEDVESVVQNLNLGLSTPILFNISEVNPADFSEPKLDHTSEEVHNSLQDSFTDFQSIRETHVDPVAWPELVDLSVDDTPVWPTVPTKECVDSASDDEFGEFSSAAPMTNSSPTDSSMAPLQKVCDSSKQPSVLECLLSHLESALAKAFSVPTQRSNFLVMDSNMEPSRFTKCVNPDYVRESSEENQDRDASKRIVWNKILDRPRIPEFRHRWLKTSIYEAYLRSVHIDANKTTPAFASHLCLLQPVRLPSKTTVESVESHTSASQSKSDVGPSKHHPDNRNGVPNIPTSQLQSSESVSVNSLSVNEMDTCFGPLDLDFLEHRMAHPSVIPTPNLSDLEMELLADPKDETHKSSSSVDVLVRIAPEPTIPPPPFNKNVQNVLSKLPNLSYMRSSNLMFPVREETEP